MEDENQQCKNCQNFEKSLSICSITNLKVNKDAKFKCFSFISKISYPDPVQIPKIHEMQFNTSIPSISWLESDDNTRISTGMEYKIKEITLFDVEKLKKYLKKRSGIIEFSIDQKKAFQIFIDQFKAFELNEIKGDNIDYYAIYSGFAPILNNNMVAELSIHDFKAYLTIWTKEIYQSFGILTFLKNSLKILFDSSSKFEEKTAKINQKIHDISAIKNILIEIFNSCEQGGKIEDILSQLIELRTKIIYSYPEIGFINEIQKWINELDEYNEKQKKLVEEKSIILEYYLLFWIVELNKIVRYDYETYRDIYSETQIQDLQGIIEDFYSLFKQIETNYFTRIIQYLMVITKVSGVTIYSHDFSSNMIEPNLISGFLTAIKTFGMQISQGDTSVTKLEYKDFEIILDDQESITGALILKGPPTQKVINKLREFVKEFCSEFNKELEDFDGDISLFERAINLKDKIFG
ncbi:MAG: hypothetical protein EAX96_10480 [Candidatus Lokiarchaeota archaeon]|nr:hypothetical protein [Candidatus Lokiarchaeota archaeon]